MLSKLPVPALRGLAAMVSPNPLNPSATLTFVTAKSGPLRASLFDVTGRLVKTLLRESSAPAGYHSVTLDGRDERGAVPRDGLQRPGGRGIRALLQRGRGRRRLHRDRRDVH